MLILCLLLLFAAFSQACLSYFLDICFEPGMIFSGWLPFLERTIGHDSFFYKPLGGCIVCSGVWQGMVTFWPVAYLLSLPMWMLPFYLVISNFMIRKMIN